MSQSPLYLNDRIVMLSNTIHAGQIGTVTKICNNNNLFVTFDNDITTEFFYSRYLMIKISNNNNQEPIATQSPTHKHQIPLHLKVDDLIEMRDGKHQGKRGRVSNFCNKKIGVKLEGVKYDLEYYPKLLQKIKSFSLENNKGLECLANQANQTN